MQFRGGSTEVAGLKAPLREVTAANATLSFKDNVDTQKMGICVFTAAELLPTFTSPHLLTGNHVAPHTLRDSRPSRGPDPPLSPRKLIGVHTQVQICL